MISLKQIQPVLAYAAAHLDDDLSLTALAAHAGLSPFHMHRVFSAITGETPRQLTLRLRLELAASLLLECVDSVLDVALACGFQSHEVFCRAFRWRYGMTPSAYRKRGLTGDGNCARTHSALVRQIGPCIGLYRVTERSKSEEHMTYTITRKELSPEPVLLIRRRIRRADIAATITEVLPLVFLYAQQHGIALAGLPFSRYPQAGPGLITIEPGMRIAASHQNSTSVDAERALKADGGEVRSEILTGGPVATTIHTGDYGKLPHAYEAIEAWIESQGLATSGPPWESYLTSPAEYPDPADWRTEVLWPLAS